MKDKTHFVRFANWTAGAAGRPQTFVLACAIIVGWALTGPLFDYSDTWQLVINTSTTIITFLMVFVIQNTQNRDQRALPDAWRSKHRSEDTRRLGALQNSALQTRTAIG